MRLLLAFLLSLFVWLGVAQADVPVPTLRAHVTDLTSTLSPDELSALDSKLMAYEQAKGSQIAVLIVPTTSPEAIEQYSMRVVEQWKLGRKRVDDGVLFLIAKDDRKMRIEVGYGLEGALPDITAKRIISDIVAPNFKAGDFAVGITAGVDAIIASIQGEPLPAYTAPPSFDGNVWSHVFLFSLIAGIILSTLLKKMLPDIAANILAAVLVGLAVWVFLTFIYVMIAMIISLLAGLGAFNRGGMMYVGNGFGGRGGGGWSGGGGGGFGGGGASGGW